ncbi:SIS domain-containing protein [Pilimelia columellifera]
MSPPDRSILDEHLDDLSTALALFRERAARLLPRWGQDLAWTMGNGGRLLVAGNGGSAAEAQHLTAELVGRLRHDRAPLSALCLSAETSSLTAIGNDYGFDEIFARQVRAHGRRDDILILLSTSGGSPNLVKAADAAAELGLRTWGMVGRPDSPLGRRCDETLALPGLDPQIVQELHLVAVHVICEHVDLTLPKVREITDSYASDDLVGSLSTASAGPVP